MFYVGATSSHIGWYKEKLEAESWKQKAEGTVWI
jgi:hypothetical protein